MKKSLVLLPLSLSIVAYAAPPEPGPIESIVVNDDSQPVPVALTEQQTIVEYRYVGVTKAQFNGAGGGGVGGLNAICASEFGVGARLATSKEAETRSNDLADTRKGWVLPTPPVTTVPDPVFGFRAYDALGQRASSGYGTEDSALTKAACGRFQIGTDVATGMSIAFDGGLGLEDCDEVYPAACSIPVTIPVQSAE